MSVTFKYGEDTVALRPDTDVRSIKKAVSAVRGRVGSVVVSLRAQDALPERVTSAAAVALGDTGDALLYVLGDGTDFDGEALSAFRGIRHLNLNVRNLKALQFLSNFQALETLTVQHAPRGTLDLDVLRGMRRLTRLAIPAKITHPEALKDCSQLVHLHCTSNKSLLESLAGHPTLDYLEIEFGTDRDLGGIPDIPLLRGLHIYRVGGLTSEDLEPLSHCRRLQALSLGALRNVSDLAALRGAPSRGLQALLLEDLPNLDSLGDVGACGVLDRLGLYGSRPKDKSLKPLRQIQTLKHLAIGDFYSPSEIKDLMSWYHGSLWSETSNEAITSRAGAQRSKSCKRLHRLSRFYGVFTHRHRSAPSHPGATNHEVDTGETLFSSMDSPFRPVRKVAQGIAIFLLIFMPITFRHLLMEAVHAETAKVQRELTVMEQHALSNYSRSVPTTIPSIRK